MTHQQLALLLRAAIATRCVAEVRQLVDSHGLMAFSAALTSARMRENLCSLDIARSLDACVVRGQPMLERKHARAVRRAS